MLEFFASAYFLGILLMVGGVIFFFYIFFLSWYEGYPRKFWTACLTYESDKEQQSLVRFIWLFAWILTTVGSLVTALNLRSIPHTFWWIFAQTLYGIVLVWMFAKCCVAAVILVQYIGLGIIRIKDWIFHDKALFSRKIKAKPLQR